MTEFKKGFEDTQLHLINPMLKAYQEEVDNVTRRAKFAENAFLYIYQKLYESPDPYPALASVAVSVRLCLLCHNNFFFSLF